LLEVAGADSKKTIKTIIKNVKHRHGKISMFYAFGIEMELDTINSFPSFVRADSEWIEPPYQALFQSDKASKRTQQ
jgi:hypothetical protein